MYLFGILLLVLSFATLYFSGALLDAGGNRYIDAFVMQPNNLSTDRIGRPVPMEQLSEDFIRERLIRKFLHEYFYVNPDIENIALRTRANSIMAAISHPDVFNAWRQNEAEDIEKLATKKYMRTVGVRDEILPRGEYYEVFYTLYTWEFANNMELAPIAENRVMYIKIAFEKGVRETRGGGSFDVQEYLQDGGDPAAVFKFRVDEVK